ncbi:MAG: hypothetical protein ACTHJR_16555 [Sphingomonas sp.]|uniref:hypothetical protein n=1 Tax=Sphingomonas sp. TaxID=28214 RepID=UPI003F821D00
METFNFCPNTQVVTNLPPDPVQAISMNGWTFTAKPTVPYQKKFKVKLFGLRWYLQSSGLYDTTTNPTINARLLEQFYERNGVWNPFTWTHPHLGSLTVRFNQPVNVPESLENSNGLIDAFEIQMIDHNPGY